MKRKIKRICVHHSASDTTTTVDDIRKWHKDRGWSDIGYHYVIEWDGALKLGRSIDKAGAHVKGWNADSIGICLVGNFQEDVPSYDQILCLKSLLKELMEKYDLDFDDFAGHRDFEGAATLCPGDNLHELIWQWKEDECLD